MKGNMIGGSYTNGITHACWCTLGNTSACWNCPNNPQRWQQPYYVPYRYKPYVSPTTEDWGTAIERLLNLTKEKPKGKKITERYDDKGNLIEKIVEGV